LGTERNLLSPIRASCHLIELMTPILTNEEFAKLRHIDHPGFKSITLPILFQGEVRRQAGMEKAIDELLSATAAIEDGNNVLILSDRG
jgi:hypothetical protein